MDFALIAGSLALRNPHHNSDLDVIIGAKEGRIFTVRLFTSFYLWLLELRRGSNASKEEGSGKVCLNHFVTPRGYELRSPRNAYWATLYKNLVPIFGDKNTILHFFQGNIWASAGAETWSFFRAEKPNWFRNALEIVLEGPIGNLFEYVVRFFQKAKFQESLKNVKAGNLPRVFFGDEELEFHPDTRRISEYLKKSEELICELTP